MDDELCLRVLRETLENARESTEGHPQAFFRIFSGGTDSLVRISQHIKNDSFRGCTIYFRLLGSVLKAFFDNILQNDLVEILKASSYEGEDIRKEITLSIASESLSVDVLSGDGGRDVVDIVKLRMNLNETVESAFLDESTRLFVMLQALKAIREVLDKTTFVEESKCKMLEFYDKLIESSEKDWDKVFDALNVYLIKWDRGATFWKREDL